MAPRRVRPREPEVRRPAAPAPRDGRVIRFRSQDGLLLAARVFEAADASGRLPLLCLPGLSRNSRDFLALGRHFANHSSAPRRVVALDYRGRGLSDRDPDWRNYRPIIEAQDVLAAAAVLGLERAVVVGTSRGGILAMILGALRPALLAGVVLNDIGPVIDGRGLARIKRYLNAGARVVPTWTEAVAAVRQANEAQFPALSAAEWNAFAEACFAEARGGFALQFDANLKRAVVDLDLSEKIPVLWPQFLSLARLPVLAIRGANSDILSAATLDEMAERHPRLARLTVESQGHAPLLADDASLEAIAALAADCDNG